MKWDCDVVKDLIPSYVDEICSGKSRAVVEEHVRECAACSKVLKQCRLTDFSAQKLEERELNGLKKIHSRMKRQTMVSYGLGILLLLLGWHSFQGYGILSKIIYYILMPVCMFGAYQTRTGGDAAFQAGKADCGDAAFSAGKRAGSQSAQAGREGSADGGMREGRTGSGKGKLGTGSVDILLMICSALLVAASIGFLQLSFAQVLSGGNILGVKPEHAGPTLSAIWGICFLAQFVILGVLWYRQGKLHAENRFGLCICITGIFLLLMYTESLRNLENIEHVGELYMQMSSVVLALGVIGTAVSFYLPRRGRR